MSRCVMVLFKVRTSPKEKMESLPDRARRSTTCFRVMRKEVTCWYTALRQGDFEVIVPGFMHNKAIHFGRKNIAYSVAILMGLAGTVYCLGYMETDGHHTTKTMVAQAKPEK
ncbi:hypothetical protein IW261DRAFT_1416841 [Armillaria novae-zelandiae]|uniref:Uncharacterized protein n=1 Tax=Armillaria novae-zelandiae TaxID=153914 RepID=A0AA39UD83_9AGAR|nr:hypothetical protein IW261DRAFT_1416841 [Armillaria novae-zelandiae]